MHLFFCASLVALSKSKFLFTSLFFLAAASYGQGLRVRWQEPFAAIGMGFAVLFALGLDHTAATQTSFLVMVVVGLYIMTMLGAWQVRVDAVQREQRQFQDAIMAQMHHEQATQIHMLRSTLVEMLSTQHDINNQMQRLVLNAELMVGEFENLPPDELKDIAMELHGAAKRVQMLVQEIRRQGQEYKPNKKALEKTDVVPVIDAVVSSFQHNHPKLDLQVEIQPKELSAYIVNGEDTLFRVIENLVLNAFQGNGVQGASQIVVRGSRTNTGESVKLEILDNGPGFLPKQLEWKQTKPFATTKGDSGSGLGMYTAEKWILASGGKFEYGNRPEGGAFVRFELPLWL